MIKRLVSLSCLLAAATFGAEDAPGWLRDAASLKLPVYAAKTPAVVLLSEERIVVEESGRVTTTSRKAIKILNREGRRDAVARMIYLTGTGKIKDLRAWIISPSGDARKLAKEHFIDAALSDGNLYDEARARVVNAQNEVDTGSVFGYEGIQEEKSAFTQYDWNFQDRLPALVSRFVLTVPDGWRAEAVTFNHEAVPAAAQNGTYSWELHDLAPLEREPGSPNLAALVPRLAVSFFPSAGAKPGLGRSMATWGDVSQWLSELSDPQAKITSDISDKAKALTDGAATEFAKIAAISQAVQGVKYVSVQTGLGRGGGYRPHTAADVFQKQYGDCKDKANLMRTMLAAIGIKAYMLSIYSGDRTYVRQEWPSPQQFNHAIVAVSVSAAVNSPAVVTHPQLGRLLIFDPTDEFTPLGDLPWHEQGSWALVDAGAQGSLIRVPSLPAASNRVERESDLTLSAQGDLQANVRETAYGQEAVELRRMYKSAAKSDFTKWIERWLAAGAPNSSVKNVESTDTYGEGKFTLNLGLSSEHYAQMPQNRMLIFRPAVLHRRDAVRLTAIKRTQPVVLEAQLFEETVHVALPAGFKVDEMPDSAQLKTPFGTLAASWKMEGGKLVFKRRLEVPSITVAPGQYDALRDFFDQVTGAEQAPVVLVREQ